MPILRVLPFSLLLLSVVPHAVRADKPPPFSSPKIIDRPIRFDAERVRLTVDYRRVHQDAAASDASMTPRMIVLHFTGGTSLQSAWTYFDRLHAEPSRKRLVRAGAVNVSAHFLVDQDGTIYRLLPETTMARHVIGLNHVAIGVENVGNGKSTPLTEAQVLANAALVRYLATRYSITHLIGHHEADRMRSHPDYKENDPAYRNDHSDPGNQFMARVRAQLSDLVLAGPPATP
jgi:N-acetylmuramoyl-L-alanine amidase